MANIFSGGDGQSEFERRGDSRFPFGPVFNEEIDFGEKKRVGWVTLIKKLFNHLAALFD